jgi:hypothetical protein
MVWSSCVISCIGDSFLKSDVSLLCVLKDERWSFPICAPKLYFSTGGYSFLVSRLCRGVIVFIWRPHWVTFCISPYLILLATAFESRLALLPPASMLGGERLPSSLVRMPASLNFECGDSRFPMGV